MTKQRFDQGLTLAQYVAQMTVNRERFVRALEELVGGPDDTRLLERLGRPRHVLVITEDWCRTPA